MRQQFMQKTIVVWQPGKCCSLRVYESGVRCDPLLGETDSLSVMPVAALVLVCMGIYIVNRPKKAE